MRSGNGWNFKLYPKLYSEILTGMGIAPKRLDLRHY